MRSPAEYDPVASLSAPMRYGPAKPPRLPTALMSAIAPAAAVPLRNAVGRPQNGGRQLQRPDTAIAAAIKAIAGARSNDATTSPHADQTVGHTTCQRRSPSRSERRPQNSITPTA